MIKTNRILFFVLLLAVLILPFFDTAQAQLTFDNPPAPVSACDTLTGLGKVVCQVGALINSLIPLLIALGVLYFVWGVVTYVIGNDEEAKTKGRDRIIWGIVGFAVIVGLWGLVNLVVTTFDLKGGTQVVTDFISSNQATFGGSGSCNFTPNNSKVGDLFNYITCIISSSVIPLLFALAMASFLWGVIQYVINGDDEAKKTKGRDFMLWGVIALAVMVSVWGLVALLGDTFGFNTSFIPQVQPPR